MPFVRCELVERFRSGSPFKQPKVHWPLALDAGQMDELFGLSGVFQPVPQDTFGERIIQRVTNVEVLRAVIQTRVSKSPHFQEVLETLEVDPDGLEDWEVHFITKDEEHIEALYSLRLGDAHLRDLLDAGYLAGADELPTLGIDEGPDGEMSIDLRPGFFPGALGDTATLDRCSSEVVDHDSRRNFFGQENSELKAPDPRFFAVEEITGMLDQFFST